MSEGFSHLFRRKAVEIGVLGTGGAGKARVLMYHGVGDEDCHRVNVRHIGERVFEHHLQLYCGHFHVVTLGALFAGERQIGRADRAQPLPGRAGIRVLTTHTSDTGGPPTGELAHRRPADRGEQLVAIGEVPVGGVGHHAHHAGRLAEHDGFRAARPGQLEPGGHETVTDRASRAAAPLRLGFLRC